MAAFYIKNSKSRDYNIKLATEIAHKFGGVFEFGAVDNVYIKFKNVAAEKAAVAEVNATMSRKVIGGYKSRIQAPM